MGRCRRLRAVFRRPNRTWPQVVDLAGWAEVAAADIGREPVVDSRLVEGNPVAVGIPEAVGLVVDIPVQTVVDSVDLGHTSRC